MTNAWVVLTGGPSSGLTSTLNEIKRRGYTVVPEAARTIIDQANASGALTSELRRDEKSFQELVSRKKMEVETKLDQSELIFFDRGMQDTEAYMKFYDFQLDQTLQDYMKLCKYNHVFVLENIGHFEQDYARTEDINFSKKLHDLLIDTYTRYKMTPLVVPNDSIPNRVDFIISNIEGK